MLLNYFWEVSMIWAEKIRHRLSGRNEMCPSKIFCYIPWRNTLGNDLCSTKHSTNLPWFVFLLVTSLAEVASSAYPLLLVYAAWEQSLASISSCPSRLFPLRPLCMLTAWWLTAALCLWLCFLLSGLCFLSGKPEAGLLWVCLLLFSCHLHLQRSQKKIVHVY